MMDADATQLLALSRVTYTTEQRGPWPLDSAGLWWGIPPAECSSAPGSVWARGYSDGGRAGARFRL